METLFTNVHIHRDLAANMLSTFRFPRVLCRVLRAHCRLSSVYSSPERHLEEHFNKVMKCETIPLLKDFDAYKSSLPVRRTHFEGEILPLYTLPFWATEDEVTKLAKGLWPVTISRALVNYLAAPSSAGKSACILPAFLASTKLKKGFTHYFHMPFANNGGNFFRHEGNIMEKAEDHGARFMSQCLKYMLEGKKGEVFVNAIDNGRPDQDEYLGKKDWKILIHIDEHHKMCEREEHFEVGIKSPGARFSKGAMEYLTKFNNVKVVATYLSRPPLAPDASSGVCRNPLAVPCLDIKAAMQQIEKLNFPHLVGGNAQKRLWGTLLFRLGLTLTQHGLGNFHLSQPDPDISDWLEDFHLAGQNINTTTALKECIKLCTIKLDEPTMDPNAAKLLVGVPERKIESIERQISDVVVLPDRKVSASLIRLLSIIDPNYSVYSVGRTLVRKLLSSHDYLSNSMLEAAYFWSLSTKSAITGEVFDGIMFTCKDLEPGRLFPQDRSDDYDKNFAAVNCDTMYFVQERDGMPTHPLADMFFCTAKKELVLVDITGGNDKRVWEKKNNLAKWIKEEQQNVPDHRLRGVILAPIATNDTHRDSFVHVVCGDLAQEQLGGFRQVFQWFM